MTRPVAHLANGMVRRNPASKRWSQDSCPILSVIPILQMRKLRLREVQPHTQPVSGKIRFQKVSTGLSLPAFTMLLGFKGEMDAQILSSTSDTLVEVMVKQPSKSLSDSWKCEVRICLLH